MDAQAATSASEAADTQLDKNDPGLRTIRLELPRWHHNMGEPSHPAIPI